jgi:CheY-like chemotaxis protein
MKKILIVEDDQNIAKALSIRLKNAGYEVSVAPDALTGVENAVKKAPDLVLLDISLPAGNGFTVAERIQSLISIATPLIFFDREQKARSTREGKRTRSRGVFPKTLRLVRPPRSHSTRPGRRPCCREIARLCASKPAQSSRRITPSQSNLISIKTYEQNQ